MSIIRKTAKIFRNESYRVFAIAIFASLVWHLFWLSAVRIVSSPESARTVKFSRVSFLGPLLSGSAMDLQVRPKERSFLERRYFAAVKRLVQDGSFRAKVDVNIYDEGNDAYHLKDDAMAVFVDEALSGEKMEPSALEE